ncbi:MAG: glycosyltransferase family 2 protein [Chloroflexi bacterium]|nr:glycosyltransferase family 2 protein [Chloroflexota bacterium]
MKLSIIIPVYNEAGTLDELLEQVLAVPVEKEVLLVDDGSDQATKDLLQTAVHNGSVQLITHPQNKGKGAAVCTGLEHVTGDVVIIQDADLEYDPQDYQGLLDVYRENQAQAVYGVRDLSRRSRLMRWGNQAMTAITNLLFGSRLHDMETCYKLIDRELMQSLQLNSRGFEIEAEITAKLLLNKINIYEAPIKYDHREEGKKLTPWDGIPTVRTLLKYRFGGDKVRG